MLTYRGRRVTPVWALPVRFASAAAVNAYVRCAYRIRAWGALPSFHEPAIVISNHQIDLDLMGVMSAMGLRGGWCAPFLSVCAKMLHEPGFFAIRLPWLAPLFRNVNLGWLFGGMGLLPIENEIRTRSIARWAFAVERRHGSLPLEKVFTAQFIARHRLGGLRTGDVFAPRHFATAQRTLAKLSDLLPEHRKEQLESTSRGVEEDLNRIESCIRQGATFYVTPEGEYSRDGAMRRFRGIWPRIAPLAKTVYLIGISYDPFAGRRLSQLYRVVPLRDANRAVAELKAARPVTTSAMLCFWLSRNPGKFSADEAVQGVRALSAVLPGGVFLDPQFTADGERLAKNAIRRMIELRILSGSWNELQLNGARSHRQFPDVGDIVAFQSRFLEETLEAAASLRHERTQIHGTIEITPMPSRRKLVEQ